MSLPIDPTVERFAVGVAPAPMDLPATHVARPRGIPCKA